MEIAKSEKTIGEEVNIAMMEEISIGDLAQNIISQINPDARIVTDEERLRPGKSEVERLFGSNVKIKDLTNWQPDYSLTSGLAETIAWFENKENLKQYKADIYNI